MPNKTSDRLKAKIPEIMDIWVERTLREVQAANLQETLALRDSLPIYLTQLVDALSTTINRTSARKIFDKDASTRIGQKHGRERANSIHYTIDQMILEYHILRQVICDVMEKETMLSDIEREVIVCSIEQAVNDAATEFSNTLRDIQEQLAQTLTHDLRSPIAAAKISAQMIVRRPGVHEADAEKARRVCNSMDRADKMISDLLDVSRLRAGENLGLEFKKCDFAAILKKVGEELSIETPNRALIKSPPSCLGLWNEEGLHRLVENLASNALKYGTEGAPVTLTLEDLGDKAVLTVHNEGRPIPEDERPTLFQQFRRGKSTDGKRGWGLGLAMVRGMAEAHSGSIELFSEEGKGTSFVLEIPKNPPSPVI